MSYLSHGTFSEIEACCRRLLNTGELEEPLFEVLSEHGELEEPLVDALGEHGELVEPLVEALGEHGDPHHDQARHADDGGHFHQGVLRPQDL